MTMSGSMPKCKLFIWCSINLVFNQAVHPKTQNQIWKHKRKSNLKYHTHKKQKQIYPTMHTKCKWPDHETKYYTNITKQNDHTTKQIYHRITTAHQNHHYKKLNLNTENKTKMNKIKNKSYNTTHLIETTSSQQQKSDPVSIAVKKTYRKLIYLS